MASSICKKRKYEAENRSYKPEWEEDFAFIGKGGKPLCLICHVSLGHYKASNLKRHYETNHKNFSYDYPPKSELRKNKLTELKSSLNSQRILMTAFGKEADTTTSPLLAVITSNKNALHSGSIAVNPPDIEPNVSHTKEKIVGTTLSHLSGANDALSEAKDRNHDQVDLFGETITLQLKLLPTRLSLSVQLKIQNILTQELLRYEESKQSSQELLSLQTEPEPQIPESPPQISNASSFSFPYQMAQKQPLSHVKRIDEASVSGVKQNKEKFASPSIEATHQRIDQPLKYIDQNLQSQSKKRKFDEHSIIQATNKPERSEDVSEKSLIERQTDLFGKSVVVQLKLIPKWKRLKLQLGIQNILTAELILYEDTKESITSAPQENPSSFRKDYSSSSNDIGSTVLPNQGSSSEKPLSVIEFKLEADEDSSLVIKEEVLDFN